MAKVCSRLLIIDASVANAPGDISLHPTSRNCREFLRAVLDICHRMALTAPIQEEWNHHQTRYARRWRTWMFARRKIEIVEVPPDLALERRIARTVRDPTVAAIIEKDRLLIEAALVTEKRVVSLDDKVRKHIQAHRDKLPEVCSVCWVNPNTPDQGTITWLKSGAPAERFRKLGHTPDESDG